MATLANKKGTVGYMVANWNHHGTYFDAVSHIDGAMKESIKYAVRHVEVHSCGKKVMRLFDIDAADMRKMEFDPEMPIFDTAEAAEEHALKLYTEALPRFAARCDDMADRRDAYNWNDTQVGYYRNAAAKLRDGDIPLEIVYPSR